VQMYEKILIATDGSESSQYAVVTAINTAKKNNAEVTALYVFDPESYAMNAVGNEKSSTEMASIGTTLAKEALEQVVKLGEDNGVKVVTKTVTGHAAASIIDESRHYDLVICGSLGRTNIARVLMGSVAEKVARMSYCPVLVCRRYKKDAA
jgi:nucleotide-binding universal stress UspA family protein